MDNSKNMNKILPKFMTKGGPGDPSTGGNVNTEAWFQRLIRTHDKDGRESKS